MRGGSRTTRLLVKALAFTLLVPGTVLVLVPYLLLGGSVLARIDPWGTSLLGVLPIVLGAALYLRCAFGFALVGRGTPAPIDPPVRLVVEGPYRYCRNPMYVGVLAVLAGEAVLLRSLPLLYLLLAMAIAFHLFVVGYEERTLRCRFGDAYARYLETVPRWFPDGVALRALYRASFLRVGAFVLVAGVVAHLLRLSVGLPVLETPVSIHSILVLLAGYAAIGCIVHARRIDLAGVRQQIVFALATGLLAVTALMHAYSIVAGDNEWLRVFPMWYSAFSALVYGLFAHFLKRRRLRSEPAEGG